MKSILLVATLLLPALHGKDVLVSCRFLGFEPAKDGITTLVAPGENGKLETITPFSEETLSKPVALKSEEGVITFRKGESDTAAAATAKVPNGTTNVIILFIPTDNKELVHETIVLDSSEQAFPPGGSIVLNHCPQKGKVTVGERAMDIKPDEFVSFGRPAEINNFNLAGVKFELETDGTWRTAFETNVRFLETQRNLFVAHIDHNTSRPRVRIFRN